MKIDKEKFNKLSQLDRIEFRQKQNKLNYFTIIILILCMALFIVSAIDVSIYECNNKIEFLFISIGGYLFSIMLLYFSSFINTKIKNNLIKEYFKVEVKKK